MTYTIHTQSVKELEAAIASADVQPMMEIAANWSWMG